MYRCTLYTDPCLLALMFFFFPYVVDKKVVPVIKKRIIENIFKAVMGRRDFLHVRACQELCVERNIFLVWQAIYFLYFHSTVYAY